MIYTAPENTSNSNVERSVFLAGSIEQGKAEEWQKILAKKLSNIGFHVYNPRRKEWDSSLEQSFTNPIFYQQVNWELNNLERAKYICFYFQPGTISPISLFELGLMINKNKKLAVVSNKEYFRYGNLEVVCDRYNIPIFENINHYSTYMCLEMYDLKEKEL